MRTTPVVGEKVWFGPRRFGWGWSPVSWEGWVALVVGGAASAILRRRGHRRAGRLSGVAMLAVCVLKGSEPGGRRKLHEYRAAVGAPSP